MERIVMVVCIVMGFLGLLAAALGFAAEAEKIKVSDVKLTGDGTCAYPRSPAFALGSLAVFILVIAQVIINTAAGCVCCKRHPLPSRSNWTVAFICFVVSWVTFVIAFLLFLTGVALNNERGEQRMYFDAYCYVVKTGVFSGAAVLSLASVTLGIMYYAIISSSKIMEPWGTQHNQGIVMGQPQVPPQSTQPVFIHEDTYNRQQFP